ncbi:hypothetical protein [Niastella sp. OAS944]|uniref:hypothetical protein n=1 Tax=Niastella sp. OAS944 TaxID=2664089 RepID=UPI0035C8538E|nr:hypothetical protein [Chitinophagaceae bacterium OAS944]
MSTLQATTLLPRDTQLLSCKIVAYSKDNPYLDNKIVDGFKTIGDFNNFFLNNPDYFIHNCEIEIEGRMTIGSHDDGEVSIEYPIESSDQAIITRIFETYNLDKGIIEILKSKPGHLFGIDNENKVIAEYINFDDYLTRALNWFK